ncbi:alpha/beta fold hydrolase [Bradyrhizobium sp. AUGA SZCCT0182]|uniref:alpha/beta fold hydrolase n=1 Tax=Bradyrhizobium sp. AUGA SZCCT0182 TaxID=2807667 RepID=UPI001BA988CF|nr:alpha/beta hydrolase [Bradyrhizobium sp. AUGA SZCCT0182]MBR1232824.1 alpha/beta hydrolase [Bradyrhizobium sp. AUGA SZCCT0182]
MRFEPGIFDARKLSGLSMPVTSANGIEIAYDDRGNRSDPAVVLVMGLATQMIAWPEAFCDDLAARGFRVIRFDNRDVGLSTKFDSAPSIDPGAVLQRLIAGEKLNPPYDLTDMAADTVGLMDRLAIENAHVVGASMGGMIAQIVAAKYPTRVRSLVSIMSSSGDPGLPQAKPEAMAAIMQARPDSSDRELAIQHGVKIYKVIGSPGYPTPDEELRAKVGAAFDRSYYPVGIGRQFAAILANGSRVEMLKRLSVPTLVLHGADDPLVPVEAGRHTAASVPGSSLMVIPGMGHDIAAGLIPVLVEAIAAHCKKADQNSKRAKIMEQSR